MAKTTPVDSDTNTSDVISTSTPTIGSVTTNPSLGTPNPVPSIPPKVAIITGASSGIGRSTALALSSHGWKLTLCARSYDGLLSTVRACAGFEPWVCAGDVCDESYVFAMVQGTVERFGRLDMVFNNAGIGSAPLPIDEIPLSTFQRVLDVNLIGSFLLTREAVKVFKAQVPQGGRIINNGSLSAHVPRPLSCPYTVSKHAITGLTKSTALDGREFNIACTQIDIGNAHTPLTTRMTTTGVLQPNGQTMIEPTFDSKHVADAIVHIASLPNSVNVLEMNIMAAGMPYVGRG